MPTKSINHLAVFVSAIVFFMWGYVWFSVIFKSQTMALLTQMGQSASMNSTSPTPYIVGFLMALLLGYGTAIALADSDQPGAPHGISFGLFMGVIFYASTTLTSTLFSGFPLGLWLLNVGWALIGFMLVGAIVGGWRAKAAA
jgi:hypothetical protein